MKGCAIAAFAAALLLAAAAAAQTGCGDALCPVEGGGYAILLPDGATRPGAFVYLHGYAASARTAARQEALTAPVLTRGMAFVAPEGQRDTLQGSNLDWGVNDGWQMARDDVDYLTRVIADATERFGLDPDRVLVAGYSRGGSMAWDLACARPDLAAGFASYAGAFWEPMPERCAGPVRLFHEHGFADRTVPIEGQRMHWFGHDFEMGEVQKALHVWLRTMDCPDMADAADTSGPVWVKRWTGCTGGSVTFALGPGGHGRPKAWVTDVLDWFDGRAP